MSPYLWAKCPNSAHIALPHIILVTGLAISFVAGDGFLCDGVYYSAVGTMFCNVVSRVMLLLLLKFTW